MLSSQMREYRQTHAKEYREELYRDKIKRFIALSQKWQIIRDKKEELLHKQRLLIARKDRANRWNHVS